MRTTLNLDSDVMVVLATEQRRTGETKGQVVGRLVRRALGVPVSARPPLPLVAGELHVDVSDVSRLLVELDGADLASRTDRGHGRATPVVPHGASDPGP